MYSWYLDAVADNWGGVVSDDYSTVFPVTYTEKLGIKQFYQAFFTREFEVIGSEFELSEVIDFIKKEYKMIHFRTSKDVLNQIQSVERIYQYIQLDIDFENDYSKNAKRLIKKADKTFTYSVFKNVEELIDLVNQHVAYKIKEFTPENIQKLKALINKAVKHDAGQLIGVYNDSKTMVAAGFFFNDKKNIIYLKGASTDEAKKQGAMYGLMNFAFNKYKVDYNVFDFGGSNVDNVADFYKKFGAKNKIYFDYTINDLPLWFKGLKKLRK